MYLTIQHDSAIVVYPKSAKGTDSPTRLIQGDRTLLADPHGIALDTKNNLLYVTNHGSVHRVDPSAIKLPPTGGYFGYWEGKTNWPLGLNYAVPGSGKNVPASITVYPKTAKGDAAPVRVIQGPKTQFDWPTGVAVNPDRDELYVANDVGNSILVFKASASGDVAPIRVIKGPKSLVQNPTGVYLDTVHNELWVSNFGNHVAAVFNPTAEGDTAPLRVIRSAPLGQPAPSFSNPYPVAYDENREQILVPN
jgi:DNA-binding beta-propeller fold protein YncE